jgi:hypothetical protein
MLQVLCDPSGIDLFNDEKKAKPVVDFLKD